MPYAFVCENTRQVVLWMCNGLLSKSYIDCVRVSFFQPHPNVKPMAYANSLLSMLAWENRTMVINTWKISQPIGNNVGSQMLHTLRIKLFYFNANCRENVKLRNPWLPKSDRYAHIPLKARKVTKSSASRRWKYLFCIRSFAMNIVVRMIKYLKPLNCQRRIRVISTLINKMIPF